MKIKLSFILIFISSASFASEGIHFLNKKILDGPNRFFYNGVEFGDVNKNIKGEPIYKIEKKGFNFLGGFITNTTGQFVNLYSLYDSNFAFENYTLTFDFQSPNGARNSFNCHAIDNYNCGKIELLHCSKSEFGYSILNPRSQSFVYDLEKHNKCNLANKSVSQEREKSFKTNPQIKGRSKRVRSN